MESMTAELEQLLGKVINELGAAANAALVIVGDKLGLYRTLSELGPATSQELAAAAGASERYVREWLAAQAASGYVSYNASTEQFSMSSEQAMVFADEESPAFMAGGFYSAAAVVNDHPMLEQAFRSGAGIPWGDHHNCLFCGTEKFFRPSYAANLVQTWLPSLNGMEARLHSGAIVADIGCGYGASTLIMAKAFPNSRFVGFDYHAPSIEHARQAAAEQRLENVRFEVGDSHSFPTLDDSGYDLVTVFDALHDMGDPVGAASRVREVLKPDGAWMIVEPAADDRLENNCHPIGRVYYAFSAAICVPSAMSQEGDLALGAQAGADALGKVVKAGGFSSVRIATQGPINMVLEARP